jgi:hypothetical protein
VKIYDDDGIQESDLIGCAQVRLQDLQPGKVKDVWLKLVKDLEIQRDRKDRGQVSLIFMGTALLIFPSLDIRKLLYFLSFWGSRFSISYYHSQLVLSYGYVIFFSWHT